MKFFQNMTLVNIEKVLEWDKNRLLRLEKACVTNVI